MKSIELNHVSELNPLILAIDGGNLAIVKLLLTLGSNPEINIDNMPILNSTPSAVFSGTLLAYAKLIAKPENPASIAIVIAIENYISIQALVRAAENGDLEQTKHHCLALNRIDEQRSVLLNIFMIALEYNQMDVVDFIKRNIKFRIHLRK